VGPTAERESTGDKLAGGAGSVEIPIFDRNQGEIESRRASVAKAEIERDQTVFSAQRAIEQLLSLFEQARALLVLYREEQIPVVGESLSLGQRAIEAGEATTLELLVIKQRAINARRDYLHAKLTAVETLLDLEAVLGTPVLDVGETPRAQGDVIP
jgi:cobalt-zinc-cadmium efflux system outer membrane protein